MLVCKKGQGISGLSEKPFQISVVLYSWNIEYIYIYIYIYRNIWFRIWFFPWLMTYISAIRKFSSLQPGWEFDSSLDYWPPFLIFQPSENLPELIERTVFHTYGRLINNTYKRKMRSLVFILKHRDSIREKVVTGEISVKKLVSSSVEQLT